MPTVRWRRCPGQNPPSMLPGADERQAGREGPRGPHPRLGFSHFGSSLETRVGVGLGLPSGSGAEWAAGLGTPVAGCQLPLFWNLERMPWKGGGVASMGIRRPSCLWETERAAAVSQLLLCRVGRPELAGAASLPSFNGCCLYLTFPLWGMWNPLPSRCRRSSRSQEPGPGWEGMQGSGLGTLPRSLRGSLPGTLRPETTISASLQVGPARLRGWCQRCCVPSPVV